MKSTNLIRAPITIELAKKITNGEIEGRIVRNYDNANVRIVCWDHKSLSGQYPLMVLVENGIFEEPELYTSDGRFQSWKHGNINKYDLVILYNKN